MAERDREKREQQNLKRLAQLRRERDQREAEEIFQITPPTSAFKAGCKHNHVRYFLHKKIPLPKLQ